MNICIQLKMTYNNQLISNSKTVKGENNIDIIYVIMAEILALYYCELIIVKYITRVIFK